MACETVNDTRNKMKGEKNRGNNKRERHIHRSVSIREHPRTDGGNEKHPAEERCEKKEMKRKKLALLSSAAVAFFGFKRRTKCWLVGLVGLIVGVREREILPVGDAIASVCFV